MNPFDIQILNAILQVSVFLFSIVVLWKGADKLVDSASRIAKAIGVSDLVIGLTIVAFGTSSPEFAVTINAALKKMPSISVGNIVGSNIFNLGFILGTIAIFRDIRSSHKLVYRDGFFLIGVTFLLLYLFKDFLLSRWEGVLLLTILVIYLFFLFVKKDAPVDGEEGTGFIFLTFVNVCKELGILLLCIFSIGLGGHFLVQSASAIALSAGVSEWVVGVTIVAAGTSAPEMATSLAAVIKGRHGMSIGNLIGSDLFNIIGVLGLAGIINPLKIEADAYSSIVLLSGMVVLVIYFLRTEWRLTRREGWVLLTISIMRWIYDFMR